MALSVSETNQVRVDVLGVSVDQSTTWTTAPPAMANTLQTPDRIVNRALNTLNLRMDAAADGTLALGDRFNTVIGNEIGADQTAFDAIGKNLIQAFADLGVGAGSFVFAQAAANTTWTIPHNLAQRIVAVQVVDNAGNTVIGDIDFDTANRCILSFAEPKAGTAVVRK